MTHAFIITLTIPDSDSLPGVAEELHELVSDSFEVISVNPWGGEPPVGIASPADLPSPLDARNKTFLIWKSLLMILTNSITH